jgi:hypothetical protein
VESCDEIGGSIGAAAFATVTVAVWGACAVDVTGRERE